MINLKKVTMTCVLGTILWIGSAARSAEPNETGLTFKTCPVLGYMPSLAISPTYAAGIVRNGSRWFPRPGENDMRAFLEAVQTQGVSRQQREFLQVERAFLENDPGLIYTPAEEPNAPRLMLFARSEQDAQKMAEAYLRFARNRFNQYIAWMQADIKRVSEALVAGQQELPEITQSEEVARKAFEEAKKQVPYRSEQQALDAAVDLDKMLNTAQVEIAGIRAMLKAIQDHLNTVSGNEAVRSKLEVMFIEESVSLQAAEARKRMATDLRQQVDSYVDLMQAFHRVSGEKEQLTKDLSMWPEAIRQLRERLTAEMEQEPKIINNKVFIYPVKQ